MMVKRLFRLALAAMLAVCLMVPAGAMAETIRPSYKQLDPSVACSLTLIYGEGSGEDKEALPETTFQIFKVADMDENVQFHVTEDFASYPVFDRGNGGVDINAPGWDDWSSLAQTLAGYVARDMDKLPPAGIIETGVEGAMTMGCQKDLEPGLYLIVGTASQDDRTIYTPTPTMVTLPSWDDEASMWVADVSANLKFMTHTDPFPDATLTRSVLKVWDDEGYEDTRPEEVVVELLRDGSVYRTATLSEATNWRHTWTDLPSDSQYQLVEQIDSEDYQVSISLEGATFVVTNTHTTDIEDPDAPYSLRRSSKAAPKAASEPVVDSSGKFGFDVVLTAANGAALAGTYPVLKPPGTVIGKVVDGKGSFRLNAGETFLIPGMPEGTSYKITEQETPGWDTSGKYNDEGTVGGEAVTFVNKEVADPGGLELPKTGGMGTAPYVILGSAAVLLSALLLLCRKRYR